MTAAAREERMRRARELEALGDVDGASRAYLDAGSLGEAARVLAGAGRYADAAELLLGALGRPLDRLGPLDDRGRRVLEKAAQCYELAGNASMAARIREALAPPSGRASGWKSSGSGTDAARDKMIQELVAAGRLGPAARVAWEAGRFEEASRWFLELGFHYEAGMCLADMNDLERGIEQLLRVPSDHKYYRRAAMRVIELAKALGRFDFDVDRFLSPLLARVPEKASEIPAYVTAASLYGQHGFDASAAEILGRALEADPDDEEARDLLERLRARGSAPPAPPKRSPRSDDSLPDLPPLDGYVRSRRTSGVSPRPSPPAAPLPAAAAEPAAPRLETAARPPEQPAPPPERAAPRSEPTGPVEPGVVVAQRYRIVQKLGQGGMAVVWRALDLELGEEIALKLLHPGPAAETWLPRFRQELSLARVLTHKNIVRVFDLGRHGESRFISMELLDGVALDEMFDQPVPLLDGIHYAVQVCAALRLAHEHGIIHRDIKASNIFVTRSGVVKLTDFGIAKAPEASAHAERALTVVGAIVGTPEYMSPEQIDDAATVGPASDLYSLGVCLYEMFTLTCPFEHDSLMGVLRMHHEKRPPPPRERNPNIPESLETVILRCLEKRPEARYQTATELARDLRTVARELR